MATTNAPKFLGPDGVLRQTFTFSTDRSSRFFSGTMDPATVDMQVSVRGSGFTSDPDIIQFSGTSFLIPNPSAYPAGLQLFPGDNKVEVRSILSNGETTSSATLRATLSLERDIQAGVLAPSGISVERYDGYVVISVDGLLDPNVVGYNFYASTAPGGGLTGYYLLNPQAVVTSETTEALDSLAEATFDAVVATNPDGTPAADPLYMTVLGTQTKRDGAVLQTDFNQALMVPEIVTRLKTSLTVQSVRQIQRFIFAHDRKADTTSTHPCIPNSDFASLLDTDPLYYAVTALYMIDGVEYESPLSTEVVASPLVVTPSVATLPTVSRQQVVRDTVLSIYRSHPEVDVKPGAVLRDTFIDPFSNEAERIRFIISFLQAAQASTTLLAIDDPNNDGTSIAVRRSPYKMALKQAFFLKDDQSVQNLLDNCFDHLASRRGVVRRPGARARGTVTFFVTSRPSVTRFIPIGTIVSGGSGIRFRTTSPARISPSGAGASYNPSTGRYSVTVFVQAEAAGVAGNLARGQVKTVVDGPSGVQATNDAPMFGGRDYESNRDLATRADGVLSAVDTGTYRGYTQNAADVPGVRQAAVVDAGHALMQRDLFLPTTEAGLNRVLAGLDPAIHTGGKVDVWLRGDSIATVTDSFAFSFEIVANGQFEPVGALDNLRFRAVNSDLSEDNPIIEMLDNPDWEFILHDVTSGKVFDLTGVTILSYDTIQLSADYNTPDNMRLTDEFRGSYRFRTANRHVMTRQPVSAILSMTGEVSGVLDPSLYDLYHASDPLALGHSNEAGDYVQVVEPAVSGVTIPSGEPISTTEEHVLLAGPEYLESLGANPTTVRVWNLDRTIEYLGPYHPTSMGARDFTLIPEQGENPLAFQRVSGSRLTEGQSVYVDYQHDEVFVVEYSTNSLVGVAQSIIDTDRHVTADVVTKEAIPVGVNITGTIVVKKNSTISVVDSAVRTQLARYFGGLVMGQPFRQSDYDTVVRKVANVAYAILPATLIAKQDGAQVVRESLPSAEEDTDWVLIGDWSTDDIKVYLLLTPLAHSTVHGGGEISDYRGVFLNEVVMPHFYSAAPDVNGIPLIYLPYGAFIIGNEGLEIPGYSDDASEALRHPFANPAELALLRQQDTQNRVLIALPREQDGTEINPSDGVYAVTYAVYGDTGVKNIEPGPTEYLVLGDLNFTYDEERDFSSLLASGRT